MKWTAGMNAFISFIDYFREIQTKRSILSSNNSTFQLSRNSFFRSNENEKHYIFYHEFHLQKKTWHFPLKLEFDCYRIFQWLLLYFCEFKKKWFHWTWLDSNDSQNEVHSVKSLWNLSYIFQFSYYSETINFATCKKMLFFREIRNFCYNMCINWKDDKLKCSVNVTRTATRVESWRFDRERRKWHSCSCLCVWIERCSSFPLIFNSIHHNCLLLSIWNYYIHFPPYHLNYSLLFTLNGNLIIEFHVQQTNKQSVE